MTVKDNSERRPIPGSPGYVAGADGSVWSYWQAGRWRKRLKEPRLLSVHRNSRTGYVMCRVARNGKQTTIAVHTLVLLAFRGKACGKQARHRNGNKSDNAISNLCWGTCKQNAADKFLHGTQPVGDRHHNAKLDRHTLSQIFYWRRKGLLQREIAAKLNVSRSRISEVLSGKAGILKYVELDDQAG